MYTYVRWHDLLSVPPQDKKAENGGFVLELSKSRRPWDVWFLQTLSLRYLLSVLLGVFQGLSTCIQTSIWLGPRGWVLECFTPSSCSQNAYRLPPPLAFHTVHDKKALHLLSSSLFSSGLAFTFRIKICLRRYCVSLVIKSCLFKTFLLS